MRAVIESARSSPGRYGAPLYSCNGRSRSRAPASTTAITPAAKTGLVSDAAANTVSSSTGPRPSPRLPAVTTCGTPSPSRSPTAAPGTSCWSSSPATTPSRSTAPSSPVAAACLRPRPDRMPPGHDDVRNVQDTAPGLVDDPPMANDMTIDLPAARAFIATSGRILDRRRVEVLFDDAPTHGLL